MAQEKLVVFTGVTGTVAAPLPATDGVQLGDLRNANQLMITVLNTSLAAADAITIRVWGRDYDGEWYPLGTLSDGSTDLTKGTLNGGNPITVNGATNDSANHVEMVLSMRGFNEVFAETSAVTGTWDMNLSTRDPGNQGLGQAR